MLFVRLTNVICWVEEDLTCASLPGKTFLFIAKNK